MFKILPNYSSPHFNISGPSNSTCFLDLSLLALRINVSVLSMTEVRLLTCVELVLRLQHVLLERFVLSTQTDPQTALEPVVESGFAGVTFVCVFFLFSA